MCRRSWCPQFAGQGTVREWGDGRPTPAMAESLFKVQVPQGPCPGLLIPRVLFRRRVLRVLVLASETTQQWGPGEGSIVGSSELGQLGI